ncbi:hypothetical protein ZYGR_0I01870 [Zygosaccharomyces rouxii]|uniref:ATP-dependent RNA helicase n=1 Tax=Zygosaccharomyces rouxii TaxID=4956 RepID=A0A1Q2ZWQ4_ZYGRO|nr:hypothetical protein ZYGR_0I01870 [Zygosaccharomyces rouxii]
MNTRCLGAKISLGSILKTRCQIIRPVRFYQKFGDRKVSSRNDFRPSPSESRSSPRNFPRAKLIEVPFEANTPEVTLAQLKNNGLIGGDLHDCIVNIGFTGLTPVQQKAIRPILENQSQDVITRAKTGTGKTFAFLIPMFQHLINTKRENPSAVKYVIVAPTRDLALQIEMETRRIQAAHPVLKRFHSLTLVGGTNFAASVTDLIRRKPQVVIATPGRLLDILQRYEKHFKQVDVKVLDEADRLLEIGFQQDLEKISSILNKINETGPDHIRTLLFSATLDAKVQDLSQSIMGKDECLFLDTVDKNEPQAHEKISQSAVIAENLGHSILATMDHVKRQVLANPNYKAILFTPTIKCTTLISELLHAQQDVAVPILEFHGKKTQNVRTKMVQKFKRDRSGILVCTDVAARGLDFPDVGEVLQIGVPAIMSQYIHRIGRTARAGKTGKAVLFMSKEEVPFLQKLAKGAQIIIKDQEDYEPDMSTIEEFASGFTDSEELVDALISAIAFYRSNAKGYGFNDNRILGQLAGSYGSLLNDKEARLPISSNTLEKLGLSNNRVALEAFDIHGSYHGKPRSRDGQSSSYRGDRDGQSNSYRGGRDGQSNSYRGSRDGQSNSYRGSRDGQSNSYRGNRDRHWYDEEPFQNFVKKGNLKNRNFSNKFYDKRKGHNPRFEN